MIHAGDHEEVKLVGNTVARRLLDGGAVVERVLRCDHRIREAVSPSLSRLCRRKLAARLAHAIASHIARDARPGVRDPRGSRNVGGSVVRGEIGRLWGLKSPSGGPPWIALLTLQERYHGTHRGAYRQAGRCQLHLRPVAFYQDRGRPPRGAGGRGSGHPLRASLLRGLGKRLERWSGND